MCFFEEKIHLAGCSPRASCYLEQGAGGSCLEIALILHRRAPEHIPGFFIKKNSDIARSGFFLSWFLEVVLSWRSLLGDMRFFEEKSALTECSPRASCYLEQGAGGLESFVVWKLLSSRSLLSNVRFFEEKSALTEYSPRASCYLEQKVGGSWILCCLKTLVLKKSSEWCTFF